MHSLLTKETTHKCGYQHLYAIAQKHFRRFKHNHNRKTVALANRTNKTVKDARITKGPYP